MPDLLGLISRSTENPWFVAVAKKFDQQENTMKSLLRYSLLVVMSLRLIPAVMGQHQSQADSDSEGVQGTVEGLVRDIACPIQNKKATATDFNMDCALQCARKGSPLIILANDGTIYTPISESMPDSSQRGRLMPFVGKHVKVNGVLYERAGSHAIAIKEIKVASGK